MLKTMVTKRSTKLQLVVQDMGSLKELERVSHHNKKMYKLKKSYRNYTPNIAHVAALTYPCSKWLVLRIHLQNQRIHKGKELAVE